IDGIPAIVIDPKGDLGNLLLTFPDLKPADFLPWVDPAEAQRRGLTREQLADETARNWKEGLAAWGQDGQRIARFRDAAEATIYTPGGSAGRGLTVLRSFAAPPSAILENGDALRERIAAATSGLLALLGIESDPLRSREHILLASLIEHAWRDGRDLELSDLIHAIQSPPFDKIGVMDIENIFPAKDRFGLSMGLNNLLASPGFAAWKQGEPLDVQRLLYTEAGKPRLSIISIAHLSDSERMFFVTILLNEVISWMRTQSGTSSLRALLYMDEVFGYFPPTANPPAKTPMLTLLKQARAFGLGVVLATQNPVDLDYKGLSNAGTWFIGRLQTERDKARVLDGLEGASSAAGATFDRQKLDRVLSGLGNRVFLLNNVHEDQPIVFQTRWALSFLRGPLSREQIQMLVQAQKGTATPGAMAPGVAATPAMTAADRPAPVGATSRPVLPPEIPEFFVPSRTAPQAGRPLLYRPALVGLARVHFVQAKSGIDVWRSLTLTYPLQNALPATIWDDADAEQDEEPELEKAPAAGACEFAPLPAELTRPKRFAALATALKDRLYRSEALTIWKSASLGQTSKAGEAESEFRVRLSQTAREQRDQNVEKLRAEFASKITRIDDQIRSAKQKAVTGNSQASQQMVQTVLTGMTSIAGAFMGRKWLSAGNMSRMATTVRAAGRVGEKKQAAAAAEESVERLQQRKNDLEAELKSKIDGVQESLSPDKLTLDEVVVKPKKADINVTQVALVWLPAM
ncbi:MAG: ATP-binding protein, partial [Planctomycetia bacterium]|nr:ATP-binding protein [Planctomycetia bacterium]